MMPLKGTPDERPAARKVRESRPDVTQRISLGKVRGGGGVHPWPPAREDELARVREQMPVRQDWTGAHRTAAPIRYQASGSPSLREIQPAGIAPFTLPCGKGGEGGPVSGWLLRVAGLRVRMHRADQDLQLGVRPGFCCRGWACKKRRVTCWQQEDAKIVSMPWARPSVTWTSPPSDPAWATERLCLPTTSTMTNG